MTDQFSPNSNKIPILPKQDLVGKPPAPLDNPLADTSIISLPRPPELGQEQELSIDPERVPQYAERETFERQVKAFNGKIAAGGVAACATLYQFLHEGVPLLLHNAPEGVLVALGILKGLEFVECLYRCTFGLSAMVNAPVAPENQERFERVQGLLGQVCEGRDLPVPRLLMTDMPKISPSLISRGWVGTILIMPADITTKLTDRELKAIIAHEVSHQGRRHTLFQVAVTFVSSLAKPCFFVGATIAAYKGLSPDTGTLLAFPLACAIGFGKLVAASCPMLFTFMFVNRQNELKTDLRACQMTGDPEALISALEKIAANPATKEIESRLAPVGLLSHPTCEERVASIRKVFGSPPDKE